MTRKIFRETLKYNLKEDVYIKTIGDVAHIHSHLTLILDIQSFHLEEEQLSVTYIIQDMSKEKNEFSREQVVYRKSNALEEEILSSTYDKGNHKINLVKAGYTYNSKDRVYKILEFKGISFKDQKIEIKFTAKPVYPFHPNTVKQKRIEYKKEQVQLYLLQSNESP